jgi:hypothetical protein
VYSHTVSVLYLQTVGWIYEKCTFGKRAALRRRRLDGMQHVVPSQSCVCLLAHAIPLASQESDPLLVCRKDGMSKGGAHIRRIDGLGDVQ